jgi:TPR repeat protein
MSIRLVAVLSLVIAAWLSAAPALARTPEGKKYALLVGVKSYDHASLSDLKHTENDVEELARLLTAGPFNEVVVLTTTRGSTNEDARPTAANIRKQLERLLRRVTKHDLVILGLAGHGLQLRIVDPKTKKEREENFFCASNAKPRDTKDLAELSKTMIPLVELFRELEDSGAGVKLMLVDACRNDPKVGRSVDMDSVPRPTRGTAALFSCKSGEKAYESDKLGKGHGVFFHYVIEALKGKAKNDKGEVTWTRLAEYVTEKVADDVPVLIGGGARQTPQELTNLIGKSPVLLGKSIGPKVDPADIARLYQKAVDLATGNGGPQDEREAARLFRQAAESDHLMAMFWLGWMHEHGKGVSQDSREAVLWYRKAAENGHPDSMNNLGWAYENGRGVNKDIDEALRWYRRAAEKDHVRAMTNLGLLYNNGVVVAKDYYEAAKWFRLAADKGDAVSAVHLGWLVERGLGVDKDLVEAARLYQKAADAGNVQAMYNLGVVYERGQGVDKDLAQSLKWYRQAAEKGDVDGMDKVGLIYCHGTGVAKDHQEAVKWFRKAAEKGHAGSMNNLGLASEHGEGVKKDAGEAFKWYSRAADKGDYWGTYNVGVCYMNGIGVARTDTEAIRWYRKAIAKGHPSAMNNLGWMYENGRGFKKDVEEALKWYRQAAAKGDENAKKSVRRLTGMDA